MKPALYFLALAVALAGVAPAQTAAAPQEQRPTQPAPPAQQQASPAPSAPPAPAGPKLPQARTQEEFQAFQDVLNPPTDATETNCTTTDNDTRCTTRPAPDIARAEAKAAEFETRFPDSELKGMLYEQMMLRAQTGNPDKAVEFGRKAIKFGPDRALAPIITATALVESTRETDLDRDEKLAEAMKHAQDGLGKIDSTALPSTVTPEQATAIRDQLRFLAHNALGMAEYTKKNYPAAEKHLKASLQYAAARPDAVAYFRLALAQDQQGKYAEALQSAEKAVELANPQDPARASIVAERDRLKKLTGQAGATPAPAKPAAPAPPKQ